jgi:hypothetical protein
MAQDGTGGAIGQRAPRGRGGAPGSRQADFSASYTPASSWP